MDRFIAFDVETPNHRNDRMSAIGVAVVEGGVVTDRYFSLVDPEAEFDRFNIALTGITPAMVRDAPTFPVLWEELRPRMEGGVLLAHNAAFDMRVLAACLRDYGLTWSPVVDYACTVQMGRRCFPGLENHRLNTLCERLGIELDHHRADSDSLACAALLIEYQKAGLDPSAFLRRYDLRAMRTLRREPRMS